jgi:hypothetical protein
MSLAAFDAQCSEPRAVCQFVRILGTGAADPTEEIGAGVTCTRVAEGKYRVTFSDNPGTFIGFSYGLGAATPSDVKGHTVQRDTWDSTNFRFDVWVHDAADTLDDLDATEYLDLQIWFKRTGV